MEDNIINDFSDYEYRNISMYLMHYPKDKKLSVSYGILKDINESELKHYCFTDKGSSGSPILSISNKKVIGIHKEVREGYKYKKGTFLKYPIIEFLSKITKNTLERHIGTPSFNTNIYEHEYYINDNINSNYNEENEKIHNNKKSNNNKILTFRNNDVKRNGAVVSEIALHLHGGEILNAVDTKRELRLHGEDLHWAEVPLVHFALAVEKAHLLPDEATHNETRFHTRETRGLVNHSRVFDDGSLQRGPG